MIRKIFKQGFSLIEVNMAIFVMAIGVMSVIALYPLGMRESRQGQDDLQQSMLADRILNQLVGALSHPDVRWSAWNSVRDYVKPTTTSRYTDPVIAKQSFEFKNKMSSLLSGTGITLNLPNEDDSQYPHLKHKVYCHRVPGTSGKIIGLQVDFIRTTTTRSQVIQSYYSEVMFQGTPDT